MTQEIFLYGMDLLIREEMDNPPLNGSRMSLYSRRALVQCCTEGNFSKKQGFFNEVFGSYLEDVDLGLRENLFGFTCMFVPSAKVLHKIHPSVAYPPDFRVV